MPDVLRGYVWDRAVGRYRSLKTGRFVARDTIIDLLDRSLTGRESRINKGTLRFIEGNLDKNIWLNRTKMLLKRQYLQTAALEAGGWEQLTPRDFGRIGARLRQEYARLAGMQKEIEAGNLSLAQAMSRMHMYMGQVRQLGLSIGEEHRPPPPAGQIRIGRRVLGQAEHCTDCVRMYDMGWQLAEDVPVPGEASVCDGNCRCKKETKEIPVGQLSEWLGNKRRIKGAA